MVTMLHLQKLNTPKKLNVLTFTSSIPAFLKQKSKKTHDLGAGGRWEGGGGQWVLFIYIDITQGLSFNLSF